MTFLGLLRRNLFYHRRGNLAVFLGVALGTAVLTGALVVGDSLRGSLRALTLDRLGWVEHAMVSGRFFRAALAEQLSEKACPLLMLQCSAKGSSNHAAGAVVLGADERFWPDGQVPLDKEFWRSERSEAVINAHLGRRLGLSVGDEITIHVQKADAVPRESLLGKRKREDVIQSFSVTVGKILPDDGMAGFNLKPSPEPANNIFVPIRFLQEKLDLDGRANAVIAQGRNADLGTRLAERLTLDDWNLKLRTPIERARAFVRYLDPRNLDKGKLKKIRWTGRIPGALAKMADAKGVLTEEQVIAFYKEHRNYLNLESRQLYLEPAIVRAVETVCPRSDLPNDHNACAATPSLVYLADGLLTGSAELPYAVIAGVIPEQVGQTLRDGEIRFFRWPDSPIKAISGEPVQVKYYEPDEHNHLTLRETTFTYKGAVPDSDLFDDPDWTPEFPGITDKLDMGNWENPPFPFKASRLKPSDESYWKRYRTTPKAYVTLETAQRLWGSRFGKVTSFRIHLPDKFDASEFGQALLKQLKPEEGGFVFQPVRELGLRASAGGTDFGVLFLSFSFFLIAAALLLVGLLFRLNLDLRSFEIGALLAVGWTQRRVRWLLLGEGLILAVTGSLIGLVGARVYAEQMLAYLQRGWPNGESLAFLRVHAEPSSLVIGYAASLLVSFLTIVWATRVLARLTPRALLAGASVESGMPVPRRRSWSPWILAAAALGAVGSLAAGLFATGHEAQAGSFFACGTFMLATCLTGLWIWFRREPAPAGQPSLVGLGVRNAGRRPVRSLLTVGLLAAATFLIVAVESFHKETDAGFQDQKGGSGGFQLSAETDIPVFEDLNQPKVRAGLKIPYASAEVRFVPLRVRAGDDASCLNLYQPLRPRVLGVPQELMKPPSRFRFSASLADTEKEKANPWILLERPTGDDSIPAIVDANSAEWILKVSRGGYYEIQDDQGRKVKLKIVGLLEESIFQSEILVGETDFLKLFPRQEGFRFFLIDVAQGATSFPLANIQSTLENTLGDQGFSVRPTAERLQAYLAVENSYLATFQALGGLGLALGALGLAIVLLRGVWERRSELALLRALGLAKPRLAWLVLAENIFLLILGLAAGMAAALVSVTPHLLGSGAGALGLRIVILLGLVLAVGLAAGGAAIIGVLRTPLLPALRRE